MKRSVKDKDAKHHKDHARVEGRESPWPFKVRPVTPKSVDRLWDTVEMMNDPKKVAAAAEERSSSNTFLTTVGSWLDNELATSGCLPQGPDPERVRIHGEALGLVVEHMGPFQEMMTKVKQMYDLATQHYEREAHTHT